MSAADVALSGERRVLARLDYGRIGLISTGHLMNDMYGNLLTALMPYLVLQGRISTTLAGLILLVYLIGSSVLQPIFGLLADQSGRRIFAVLGPFVVGAAACLTGVANGVGMLFLLAAVAGLGTSAFHPQAASMIDKLSPRNKGWTMSLFSMGGNIGFAVGPMLAAGVGVVGLHWSPLAILPGAMVTVFLVLYAPSAAGAPGTPRPSAAGLQAAIARSWRPLFLIVSVIAIRSAAQYALIIFLPLYSHLHGLSAGLGSIYAFVLSLAGALGGLAGGHLSDRYNRTTVVVLSLAVSAPLLYLTLVITGPLIWPVLALAGAALLASNSVTVVQGQELLPENTGVASGLTLGLAFGLSGIIASGLTTLSDHVGVGEAIFFVPWLPVVAGMLAFLVPAPQRATA